MDGEGNEDFGYMSLWTTIDIFGAQKNIIFFLFFVFSIIILFSTIFQFIKTTLFSTYSCPFYHFLVLHFHTIQAVVIIRNLDGYLSLFEHREGKWENNRSQKSH